MPVCTKCKLPKHMYEFFSNGRPKGHHSACKDCENARHRDRLEERRAAGEKRITPSTAADLAATRVDIAARLGFFPEGGCMYRPGFGPMKVCPAYRRCKALPADAAVLCEVAGDLPLVGLRPDKSYEAEYG